MKHKLIALLLGSACAFCGCEGAGAPTTDAKASTEVKAAKAVSVTSVTKGIRSYGFKYLLSMQNKDGSYGSAKESNMRLQTTALTVWAFTSSQRQYREADGPFISKAAKFITKAQNKDGSFGSGESKKDTTVICAMALDALPSKKYGKLLAKVEKFLKLSGDDIARQGDYEMIAMKGAFKDSHFAKLFVTASDKISDKSADAAEWMTATALAIEELQIRGDDTRPEFGSFKYGKNRYDSAPITSTALACSVADRIRDNAKKFGLK